MKECAGGQYKFRTTELQSAWRLVAPKTVSYASRNNPANEVVARSFVPDRATIPLERGDCNVTLWQAGSADDGELRRRTVDLAHKGSEVNVNWLSVESGETNDLDCKAR